MLQAYDGGPEAALSSHMRLRNADEAQGRPASGHDPPFKSRHDRSIVDAGEDVFPSIEQHSIDHADQQEGERDRIRRSLRQTEIGSAGGNGKCGGETYKGESSENDLNES